MPAPVAYVREAQSLEVLEDPAAFALAVLRHSSNFAGAGVEREGEKKQLQML